MSQQSVEIVKNAFRGLHERGVEGLLEFLHEDFEYLPVEESAPVRRRDGMHRYLEGWLDAWDEWRMEPTEFRESGAGLVVTVAMSGRGRGSGVEVAMEFWQVWHFREGRGARIEEYTDHAAALEAVGLRE